MTELISVISDPDPTAGGKIRFFAKDDDFIYYIADAEIQDDVDAFYAIMGGQRPLFRKAQSVVFGLPPDTILFLVLFGRRCYRLSISERSITFVNLDVLKYFPGTDYLS